jgi:hypothetical protein
MRLQIYLTKAKNFLKASFSNDVHVVSQSLSTGQWLSFHSLVSFSNKTGSFIFYKINTDIELNN